MVESKEQNKGKREINKNTNYYHIKLLFIISLLLILFFNHQEFYSYKDWMSFQNVYNKRNLEEGESNEKNEVSIVIDKNLGTRIIDSSHQAIISQIIVNGIPQTEIKVDLVDSTDLVEGYNNITIKFNTKFTSCFQMFYELNNIISIDLSDFDFSTISIMRYTFYNCASLKTIKLKNDMDLPRINMERMFVGCSSLTSLDLSNWKSSHLGYTFCNCTSLSSINFNNFDTSAVVVMNYTFFGCSSLTTIDLSSFNTSSTDNICYLFYGCASLVSIDLDHFDTSKVTDIRFLFTYCSKLKDVKINNFH